MHRPALCLRTCQYSRLGGIIHSRHAHGPSKAGVGFQVDDGSALESLTSWEEYHAREVGRRPVDAHKIVFGDLRATLEAHRDSNRSSVVRKIDVPSDMHGFFLRPSFNGREQKCEHTCSKGTANGGASVTGNLKSVADNEQAEEKGKETEGIRVWPAHSVQAQKWFGRNIRRRLRTRTGSDFVSSRDLLEYSGLPLLPSTHWACGPCSTSLLQRPWLAYMGENSSNGLDRLSSEIKAYEAYMRLTPDEDTAAQLLMSDVNSITRKSLRKAPLTMLGSRSTGLATPLSDFDLTFSTASTDGAIKRKPRGLSRPLMRQAVGSLREVEKDLRYSIKLQDTKLVVARIPIIETTHCSTGLKIQIQTMAPYQPAQEYSAAYLNEFPSLRSLFVVLRYCLEIRGLTTVYEGGLGSYSLLMMIVNALKHSSGVFVSEDLAGQLLYVLHFYGNANLYRYGFSANPPRVFEKLHWRWSKPTRKARSQEPHPQDVDQISHERNRRKPYLLSLQDPANDSNDLGKNSYAIKHVQAVFAKARQSILEALDQGAVAPQNHDTGEPWSYLDHLVKADYKAFEANRSKVERFAKDPLSKDYDYTAERVTEDFQKRVKVYKSLIARDEHGQSSARPAQILRIRRMSTKLALDKSKWSADSLDNYLRGPVVNNIRNLWLELYDIRIGLAKDLKSNRTKPLIRKYRAVGLSNTRDGFPTTHK